MKTTRTKSPRRGYMTEYNARTAAEYAATEADPLRLAAHHEQTIAALRIAGIGGRTIPAAVQAQIDSLTAEIAKLRATL